MNNEVKCICSCGLSAKFPVCDGDHFLARGRDPKKLQRCGAVQATAASVGAEPDRRERVKSETLVRA